MRMLLSFLGFVLAVAVADPAHAAGREGKEKAPPKPVEQATLDAYKEHCAACHGEDRLGGQGPALLPDNLRRLRLKSAIEVIANGRPATQMEGFAAKLSVETIAAIADYIYTPLDPMPTWDMAKIAATHEIITPLADLPAKPLHGSDPMNLFTVVETGDQHITILDGDRFEPIWRFPSDYALHGGAKYSPDGRFVYLASRDG
ncbi:MAG: nitrite reductase, partial [Rhodospirillales bacterium]|nr:nitrite reductase [Rhodospirillales bacterium]